MEKEKKEILVFQVLVFKLTDDGNFDIDEKRLTDVADSIDEGDAVNLKVLKEHTQLSQNNYHLQPSFRFYKDFGDKSQLTVGSPPNTSPDHFFQNHKAHNDAYIIEKEGYDSGAPAARQAEPHKQPIYGKQKETHELIFSWLSRLAVLLVGAYARRRRPRRWSRATWRPYSK